MDGGEIALEGKDPDSVLEDNSHVFHVFKISKGSRHDVALDCQSPT